MAGWADSGQYRTGMEVLDLIISTGVPVTWMPGHRDHKAIRARARRILPL